MQFKTKKELFQYVWQTRPHVSELSGKPLFNPGHFQFVWQFLHVLPHGTYPKYKFNPDNILLALPYEHEKQEQFHLFVQKQLQLKQEYYKKYYGKDFD